MMTHDDTYLLMMDALDGEMTAAGRYDLSDHLRACPLCAREWAALQAIDALFRHSPALSPAAGFTQRALARLPHGPYRLYALGSVYLLALLSGLLPLLGLGYVALRFGPALLNPALFGGIAQSAFQLWQLLGAILGALWQGFVSLGALVNQQPALLGYLFLMLGVVFLWTGVLRQPVGQPRELS